MFIDVHAAMFFDSTWSHMFLLDQEKVTFLEKIIRPVAVYFFLIIMFRVLGNRELAQLNPMDLVLLLLLSNTVQNAIIGDDTSLSGGILGAIALLGINYGIVFVKLRSKKFEKFIEGKPHILVKNGKLDERALRRELLTKEDLNVLAHEKDLDDANKIEECLLDPNGSFYVKSKDKTDDDKFKKDVLEKIDGLNRQLSDLQTLLKKN